MEEQVKDKRGIRQRTIVKLAFTVACIILAASAASLVRFRVDLTGDKRYTLSAPTKKILSSLKHDIYVQVYLDGEMPIPMKRLKRSAEDMLDEFRIASHRRIDYEFINPSAESNSDRRKAIYESLLKKGLVPVRLQSNDREGGALQKIIFPGMIINYNGKEIPVNFLRNNPSLSYEQNILHSSEGLEYELIQPISTLSSDTIYKVAFIEGHGELNEIQTNDITADMFRFFSVDRGVIGGKQGSLDKYSAIIVAGPEKEFPETDKLVIDQYIMHGGKVMWLFDEVKVNEDSLLYGSTVGLYRPLNIEDMLFRYGARVNPEIIQDLDCREIRLKVVGSDGKQDFVPAHWLYYPLLWPLQNNPITKNLNKIEGEFSNYIDTVGLDPAIKKKVLLATSPYTRTVSPPRMISLREAETIPDEKDFTKKHLPVAVLLEGTFPSAFRNRPVKEILGENVRDFRLSGVKTKMIVVADADIIKNNVRHSGKEEIPMTLGQDIYSGETYGNKDFILNSLNYLVDDRGIMELRSRVMKMRLLDSSKVKSSRLFWQLINVTGPVLLVLIAGTVYSWLRRRRYTRITAG